MTLRRSRYPLGSAHWWATFVTFLAFVLNEAIGPVLIYVALIGWAGYAASRPRTAISAFSDAGLLPWLFPLLAVISTLWSNEPATSFRMSLELALTVAMSLLAARAVKPADLILAVAATTGAALLASLFVRHQYRDFMTGIVSWAGVFTNKNTLSAAGGIFSLCWLSILFNGRADFRARLLAPLAIAFGLTMAVLARSIATIAATGAGIACLLAILTAQLTNARMRVSYLGALAVAMAFGGVAISGILIWNSEDILALVGKDPTLTGRTQLWYWAGRFAADNPILGVGYQAFWIQGYSPAEYLWKSLHIASRFGFHFHSLYHELMIELGILGLCAGGFTLIGTYSVSAAWIWRETNSVSGFFFAFLIMITIIQMQGLDLFTVFNPWHALFASTFLVCRRSVQTIDVPRPNASNAMVLSR